MAERLREFGVDEIHEGIAQDRHRGDHRRGAAGADHGAARRHGRAADRRRRPAPPMPAKRRAGCTPAAMTATPTMLLGAAKYLAETRNFSGRVALIFQPAEEDGGGARRDGARRGSWTASASPRSMRFTTSRNPPWASSRPAPGPIMAAVDEFRVTVKGTRRSRGQSARDRRSDPRGPRASRRRLPRSSSRNRAPSDDAGRVGHADPCRDRA